MSLCRYCSFVDFFYAIYSKTSKFTKQNSHLLWKQTRNFRANIYENLNLDIDLLYEKRDRRAFKQKSWDENEFKFNENDYNRFI